MPQNSQALREKKKTIPTNILGYTRKAYGALLPTCDFGKSSEIFFTHFFSAISAEWGLPQSAVLPHPGRTHPCPGAETLLGQGLDQGLPDQRQGKTRGNEKMGRGEVNTLEMRQPCRFLRQNRRIAIRELLRGFRTNRPQRATIKSSLFPGLSRQSPESWPIPADWRPRRVWPDSWITPSETAATALLQSRPLLTSSSRAFQRT